jgi:hypothetical protein
MSLLAFAFLAFVAATAGWPIQARCWLEWASFFLNSAMLLRSDILSASGSTNEARLVGLKWRGVQSGC